MNEIEKYLNELENGRIGGWLQDRVVVKNDGFYLFENTDAQGGSYCSREAFLSKDFKNGYCYNFQRGRGGDQGKISSEIKSVDIIKEIIYEKVLKLGVVK